MRVVLAASLLAVAAALAGCQWCVDGPRPHGVSNQPIGARCASGAQCAAGLACIARFCTIPCDAPQVTCPAGSVCVEGARDSRGELLLLCLPSCQGDADCLLGATVGGCLYYDGPSYCDVPGCQTDADCAHGARCVGASEARGITWNEYCEDGYCQL